ncbi:MAG TPA: MFS transporter [Acidimicrobiia bacterium]|nr:MFS transporter [Acidimicrobiia bacterium]
MSDNREDAAPSADETAFAPLRVSHFRWLWTSSIFSNVGSFFQVTAGSWLMWEMTASPAWVGWMAASRNLPLLVLALPAGVLADRISRTTVLVTTQILMGMTALAMAVTAWLGLMTPGVLLGLGIVLGVGVALNAPAWQAMVPDLVPRAMVTSAVALNSVSFNMARAVGPALAGAVVAGFGAALAFGVNAVSYLGMIVVLAVIGRKLIEQPLDRSSVVRSIVSGVRFARHTSAFRRLLVMGMLFALGSAVLQSMLPVRTEELGESVGTYGLLLGVIGVGAAFGGLTLRRVTTLLGRNAISITIVMYGVLATLVGLAPTTALTIPPLLFTGMCWVWTVATLNATVQLLSPDWVRGRAASLWLLAHAGFVPVGSIMAGVIAESIGAGSALVVLSIGTIGLGLFARVWGIQDPASVESPEFSPRRTHEHPPATGGPVMIHNTWHVGEERAPEFVEVMREVRVVRLKTGGYRWRLFRDVGSPEVFNEVFFVRSWEEHLLQHRRIDDAAAAVLGQARRFDLSETGPIASHSISIDLGGDLVTFQADDGDHRTMHAVDGSIPLRSVRNRLLPNGLRIRRRS